MMNNQFNNFTPNNKSYSEEEQSQFLSVGNFGVLQNIYKIRIKKITVFVGESQTGKSTIAKLLAIFNYLKSSWHNSKGDDILNTLWQNQLDKYGLTDYLQADTYLRWEQGESFFEFKNGQMTAYNHIPFNRPTVYIPAKCAHAALL